MARTRVFLFIFYGLPYCPLECKRSLMRELVSFETVVAYFLLTFYFTVERENSHSALLS